MAATLPELLFSRSAGSSAGIGYLDSEGTVARFSSYADLYADASSTALRLLSLGLKPETDIVVTSFPDHESHIRVFWACCLAGIRLCPIPPLHPDPSRRALFFEHLQSLFHGPTVIADEQTIADISVITTGIKTLSLSSIEKTQPGSSCHASLFPERRPSPDDVVCFMLTSGSTGNPKAVGLRHSNLLSSVRGKIKHHGTSSSSRFLNWVAFDHVACVSEVHIQAMEADAIQYHTSPSSIIRCPRNLLDWCSTLAITYSFSPNFLIAQICRDVAAAPFPAGSIDLTSMKAFISGGESVPVRTAVDFADIIERYGAPRNSLRAGFGMSETGAGCIYDTRPIVRDVQASSVKYLSLGKCCDGVSVRTASPRTGEICAPGETGQLQLYGPTVFREYYRDPQATFAAFTSDGWFITGDTAQLDYEGNLRLMGRDKDCININGVKYPSVDIEHYIEDSAIEGVMNAFVYACPLRLPDSDTESYAIFFQHVIPVETELDEKAVQAINRARRAIRDACIILMARPPHVVLPLPRKCFTKTALGKVSRTSLVDSYLQGTHASLEVALNKPGFPTETSESGPANELEAIVFEAISSVFELDVSTICRAQTLFDIGASSMHLMRLKHVLQEHLRIQDLPTIEVLRRPEVGQLCDYLRELTSARASEIRVPSSKYDPLICLNPRGSKPPLFLVHPGVGEVLVFVQLARILDDDRPVYALRARGFDLGETTFGSFEEMVSTYTSAIEACHPDGPYFIAGYSFGAAVAFGIGKELESRGKRVSWIGVLNLPPHIQTRMNELTWVEVLLNIFMFLALIPSTSLDYVRSEFLKVFPGVATLDEEPASGISFIPWLFEKSDQERLHSLKLSVADLHRWTGVAYDMCRLGRTFVPSGTIRGALMTIFCAVPLPSMGTREQYKNNQLRGWESFCEGKLELTDVDGQHYTMLSDEHVDSFATKMKEAIHRAELPQIPGPSTPSARKAQLDFDEVPTIDFSLSERDPSAYFEQLRHALEDVGFGIFVNVPGFEDSFQKELFTLAEQLYQKPHGWKQALGTANSYCLRGYFRLDDVSGPHKAHAEAFRFGPDLPEPVSNNKQKVPFWLRLHEGPNQWPAEADIPHFREKMETLFSRYHALNLTLNKHICRLLDIPQAVLDEYFPEKIEFNSAIWHYLPVTPEIRESSRNGFAQGMHEHRDPSTFLTCLIQSRPGLQVQNHRGDWIDIPMVKGGVICNIGMQLMRLTGGKLVATTHRVNTLKIEEDRYTIPYVLSTKLDKPVVTLPQYNHPDVAKLHAAPNPKILKLMSIDDPLVRSGYARLSLFPSATQKLYPEEFEQARQLGIV